ncbi:MAG: Dps family protein [Pseudobdellovibrionaceae bacterium]
MKSSGLPINTGISEEHRSKISENLLKLLADTYTLYLKTHNFHWNVEGPMFQTLHTMFETQYTDLWTATDLIAERIRGLGFYAPGSYKTFSSLTSIKEEEGIPQARMMIAQLLEGHETVARTARSAVEWAEKASDEATLDLLTERLQHHEKTAWMLRSLIKD